MPGFLQTALTNGYYFSDSLRNDTILRVDNDTNLLIGTGSNVVSSIRITSNKTVINNMLLDNVEIRESPILITRSNQPFITRLGTLYGLEVEKGTILREDLSVGNSLTVSNLATFGSNVSVHCNLDVIGSTILRDDLSVGNNLTVSDIATFKSNVTVHSNLDVIGSTILRDDLSVGNSLTVSDIATFGSNVAVHCNLDVIGSTILRDDLSVGNSLTV